MYTQSLSANKSKVCCCLGSSLAAAIGLALCLGCNNGRFSVQGDVSYNGTPVDDGTISLEPLDGQGPSTGGRITGGKYQLSGVAAPLPGKKTVRISATRRTGRTIPASEPAPPGTMVEEIERYIPEVYNTRSTLTCEVLPEGCNQIDFYLKRP
jgi:hypothetical protein